MLAIVALFQGLHLQVAKIVERRQSKGVGAPAPSISRTGEDESDLRLAGEVQTHGPEQSPRAKMRADLRSRDEGYPTDIRAEKALIHLRRKESPRDSGPFFGRPG